MEVEVWVINRHSHEAAPAPIGSFQKIQGEEFVPRKDFDNVLDQLVRLQIKMFKAENLISAIRRNASPFELVQLVDRWNE